MIILSGVLLLTVNCCQAAAESENGSTTLSETCSQLHDKLGGAESGYYQLKHNNVYCDMQLECGGYKGGWTRVISLDARTGESCPKGWYSDHMGRYCIGGTEAGCYSVKLSINQTSYARMCGHLRGYQRGSMNAFFPAAYAAGTATGYEPEKASASINGPYVDGVSVTVGEPRKHIWTYAVGLSDNFTYNYTNGGYNCPCAQYPGPDPPSFVQQHYYCESGNTGRFTAGKHYNDDVLWDGQGCGMDNNCCTQAGSPWFFRQFPVPITGDIEIRICRDQSNTDEEILVEQMSIYIQ